MRLTCPNCGARYEVDDALIPEEGRDVQCSDCFTTWFQAGVKKPVADAQTPRAPFPEEAAATAVQEAVEAQLAEPEAQTEAPIQGADAAEFAPREPASPEPDQETAPEAPEPETDQPEPEPEVVDEDSTVPLTEAKAYPDAENADEVAASVAEESALADIPEDATRVVVNVEAQDEDLVEDEPVAVAQTQEGRREIDPEVRDILRSEAEREARLRQTEADPVETQAEMPLEETPDDENRARRRAELEDAQDAFTVGAAGANGSRRDLLPDIEEINSTLRATEDRGGDASSDEAITIARAAEARRRRGVRLGFLLTLALTAGLIWVYLNADMLRERVPSMAGAVDGFTAQIDSARYWLDDLAQGLASSEGDGS